MMRLIGLLVFCVTLAACDTRVSTSATTNAPVQYSHVFVTIEQVWVHENANAGPDDGGWIKTTLDTPQTLDLVELTDGELREFASQLPVPTGTYGQLRLILADTSAPLASSAQSAGAQFNNEVDFFDGFGVEQRAPLAVPNATSGVSVPIKLTVRTPTDAILAALGAASGSQGTTSAFGNGSSAFLSNTSSGFLTGNPGATTNDGTIPSDTDTTTNPNATPNESRELGTVAASAAIVFDAARDIAPFTFSGQRGFTLNARLAGYDLADVGTIRSQLDVSALVFDVNTNRSDVQVTAEALSADGSRHVPVLAAPVNGDGTFVLYPFPLDDDSPQSYDLVIHGPGIQTVIVKSVPVQRGSPATAPTVNLGNPALAPASSTFAANVSTSQPVSVRGAHVGFYQTLPGSDEVPYLIEERAVDPLSGVFATDQILPTDPLVFGTFAPGALTLASATPTEGQGAYRVAASAALFGDGPLSDTALSPVAATILFDGPALTLPPGAASGTITATVNVSSPARYDRGALVITHDGAIVAAASLDTLLGSAQPSGTLTFEALPGGAADAPFPGGTYLAEVWAWNSGDPAGTFTRQPAETLIDLRSAAAATTTVTLD